jgi:O-antigen ligase
MDGDDRLADSACIALIVATVGSFTSPPLGNIAAGLALVLALASAPTRARLIVVARQPLGLGALGLLATMTVAMLWADATWLQRFDAWWNWRVLLLVVLAAAAFGQSRWKLRFCASLVAVVAAGAIVSIAMWWAKATMEPPFPGVLFRNHVTQSMALAVGAVLGAVLSAQGARSVHSRWLLAGAAIVCVANLVFVTTGRSGQVALVVAALASALLVLRGRSRWLALAALPALAATLTLASPALQQRYRLIVQEAPGLNCSSAEESSTALRLLLWRTSLDLIRVRPWFGYGVGGFTPAFEKQLPQEMQGHELTGWCARTVHDPHNQFLRVTVEAGVLGLLAFLGLIVGAARQPAAQPYRSCGLALLAAWCTTSLFNSHFQTFNEGHLIALLLGALLAPDAQQSSAVNTASRTSS